MLKYKYNKGREFSLFVSRGSNSSHLWSDLVAVWSRVTDLCCWNVGDGKRIDFWKDKWLKPGMVLADLVLDNAVRPDVDGKVADMVNIDGEWDLQGLDGILSNALIDLLIGKHPPREGIIDRLRWGPEASRVFSVNSCYKNFMGERLGVCDKSWLSIWNWKGLERIKFFLWLVKHNRLCTNCRRASWSNCNPNCDVCVDIVEDCIHVLRDCEIAKKVWEELLPVSRRVEFFDMSCVELFMSNLNWKCGNDRLPWSIVFGVTCWLLWKWQNK